MELVLQHCHPVFVSSALQLFDECILINLLVIMTRCKSDLHHEHGGSCFPCFTLRVEQQSLCTHAIVRFQSGLTILLDWCVEIQRNGLFLCQPVFHQGFAVELTALVCQVAVRHSTMIDTIALSLGVSRHVHR